MYYFDKAIESSAELSMALLVNSSMNTLGTSDLKVSQISLGGMSLGESQQQVNLILDKAIDEGINFFDTADIYAEGHNEILIGKALKNNRKNIVLATKVGNQPKPDGEGWQWNASKAYIIAAVEQSLRRLQTDYIDLYQLHGGTIEDPIEETVDAFETLKRQGKIRWYGLSSIRPNVIRAYAERSNIVTVMMQYSLLDRRPAEEILDLLFKNNISVITRGALAQGLLINKPADTYLQHQADEVLKAAKAIKNIAEYNKETPLAVAIAYVFRHPAVASAVTGIRTMEQLEEMLSVNKNPMLLADEEYRSLNDEVSAFYYELHR